MVYNLSQKRPFLRLINELSYLARNVMKTVFFINFVLLLCHSYLPAQTIGVSKNDGLVGPIRSLRYVNPYQTQVVLYDRQGNEIERTLYKTGGSVEHQVNKFYNAEGLISGWKEYYGKGVANAEGLNKHAIFTYRAGKLMEVIVYREDSIAHKSTYVYDNRGNKVQEINSGPDAIFTSRSYKYDSAGNLIEEISTGASYSAKVERTFDEMRNVIKESYFDNGVLKFYYNRTYEKGRLIKEGAFNSSGEVTRITLNSYNSEGKLVESTLSSRSILSKTIIEYGEAGWMKKKETLTTAKGGGRFSSEDPAPGRVVIKYNEKGLEIERLNYSVSGTFIRRQTSSFDERGKQSELVFYKADGEVESKQVYEYDEYGNRIKTISVTVSPKGEVQYLILEQRTISYY